MQREVGWDDAPTGVPVEASNATADKLDEVVELLHKKLGQNQQQRVQLLRELEHLRRQLAEVDEKASAYLNGFRVTGA